MRSIFAIAIVILCHAETGISEIAKGTGVKDDLNITHVTTSFDEIFPSDFTGYFYQNVTLHCMIKSLGLKTVTWIRRRDNHVLSVGKYVYTTDHRFSILHNKTDDIREDWALVIQTIGVEDQGAYECIVPADPKISKVVRLFVKEDINGLEFCPNDGVKCPISKKCVYIGDICDNKKHCTVSSGRVVVDDWDENFCEDGYKSRACRIWGCSDKCTVDDTNRMEYKRYYDGRRDLFKPPFCSCNSVGFKLDQDSKTCIDVDECSTDNGGCEHNCVNKPGSYYCTCADGYDLRKNNLTCEAKDPAPDLFYSTSEGIKSYQLRFERSFNVLQPEPYVVGLTLNRPLNRIIWIQKDIFKQEGFVRMSLLKDGERAEYSKISSELLKCPEDIQIERNTSRVYIADMCTSQIIVLTITNYDDAGATVNRTRIIENKFIQRPVALQIDHTNYKMHWADWGDNLGIQVSDMNGQNPRVLVNTDISKPKALALDRLNKRLYWTDFELGVIESIDLNGESRSQLYKNLKVIPFALAVFEEKIYFSQFKNRSLLSCNKIKCERAEVMMVASDVITDLQIQHWSQDL